MTRSTTLAIACLLAGASASHRRPSASQQRIGTDSFCPSHSVAIKQRFPHCFSSASHSVAIKQRLPHGFSSASCSVAIKQRLPHCFSSASCSVAIKQRLPHGFSSASCSVPIKQRLPHRWSCAKRRPRLYRTPFVVFNVRALVGAVAFSMKSRGSLVRALPRVLSTP